MKALPVLIATTLVAGCSSSPLEDALPPPKPLSPGAESAQEGAPDGSTTPPGSMLDGGGGRAAFRAGEAFDYARVAKRSQMVETMLQVFGYATSTAPRAVAVNAEGLGFVAVHAGATQEENELIAKQACFVIGGARPCALLAKAGTFAVDEEKLTPDFVLAKPAALSELPFMTPAAAAAVATAYNAAPNPKALAIGLDGTVGTGYRATPTGLAPSSAADAMRVALERCEMQSRFSPCTVFISGATVSFDPVAPRLEPTIDYGRRTLATNLPGSMAGAWTTIQSDYLSDVPPQSGSIYLSRKGAGGYFTSASAATADAEALEICNARASGEPCFKYATNRNIVFGTGDLLANAPGNVALHCKAVPRASCAVHRTMGCATSGDYYLGDATGVKLAACVF